MLSGAMWVYFLCQKLIFILCTVASNFLFLIYLSGVDARCFLACQDLPERAAPCYNQSQDELTDRNFREADLAMENLFSYAYARLI